MPTCAQINRRAVAIVAPGEVFGGAERHLLVLTEQLRRLKQPFTLYLLYDGPLGERARDNGVPVKVIGSGRALDLRALRSLSADLVGAEDAWVLHAHGYKAATICGVIGLMRRYSIVKTEHGMPEYASWRGSRRLLSRGYRTIENLLCRWTGAVIVYVTGDLQSLCAKEHAWARRQVIYNGIDVAEPEYLPRPDAYRAICFNVAVIGRLEPVKGVEHAIRAWALPDMPTHAHLHVIGDGPLEASLRALVAAQGLDNRVTFHGFRRDVLAYVKHADAVLMPSLHEGLPYTLLESLRAVRPVIASRTGGLAEVLQHEVTALLVNPRSVPEIAANIGRLVREADLGEQISRAGYALLREKFSAQTMASAYCDLYNAV